MIELLDLLIGLLAIASLIAVVVGLVVIPVWLLIKRGDNDKWPKGPGFVG